MKRKLYLAFIEKTKSELVVGHNKMRHRIEIDESQRQLILLALAHLAEERPGWENAIEITASCFPNGYEVYKDFQQLEADYVLQALGSIGEKKK